MKGKFKLFPIIFLITVLVVGYFSYDVVKERYWQGEAKNEKEDVKEEISSEEEYENGDSFETEAAEEADDPSRSVAPSFLEIAKDDCENECEKFKDDGSKLTYCQNVCGLNEESGVVEECDKKSGLDKDYCFKDLAIKEKDLEKCDLIQDGKIKKTCQNRLFEDLIDSQEGELE